MRPLLDRLNSGNVLVGDGAMGTMLMARGVELGTCLESISLTRPDVLVDIARAYLDAGADIIQTNTFGASPAKLAAHDLAHKTTEINRAAVLAVREAVGDHAHVSGSCGPSGRVLEPYGDADPDELYGGFHRQLTALIDAGVDVICIETMTDLAEARLAVKAAKNIAPDLPVIATMTFDPTPRGLFTVMGVSIQDAADGLREAGADILGSNCGNGIEIMIDVARQFRTCCDLPIIVQPNAGRPEMRDGTLVYNETPTFMADKTRSLLELGISIIGGCCGTTPEHIHAIRQVVNEMT